jgi:hypothetical protein
MAKVLATPDRSRLLLCPDGTRLATPGDPACCGTGCPFWVRFRPCGTFDCLGEKTPVSAPRVWLCGTARCNDLNQSNGIPESIIGRPNLVVLIGGRCYISDGAQTNDAATIPPDEPIVGDLLFPCRTGGCENADCGSRSGWARAYPCDPANSGGSVYFCKGSLLRPCVVTDVVGPGGCWVFKLSAPEVELPPGQTGLVFPPDYPWDTPPFNWGSCCWCHCTPIPPLLQPIACLSAGPWPNGCCPSSMAESFARIDYEIDQQFGGGQRLYQRLRGFGPALAVPVRQQERFWFGGVLLYDIEFPIGTAECLCPAREPTIGGNNIFTIFPNNDGGLESCTEFRAHNRWSFAQVYRPPGSPSELRSNRGEVRLFIPDSPPCTNSDCFSSFVPIRPPITGAPPEIPIGGPQPATGSDGGTITVRGGGSRPIDPMVAAILAQQARGGGCAGCGDGWIG